MMNRHELFRPIYIDFVVSAQANLSLYLALLDGDKVFPRKSTSTRLLMFRNVFSAEVLLSASGPSQTSTFLAREQISAILVTACCVLADLAGSHRLRRSIKDEACACTEDAAKHTPKFRVSGKTWSDFLEVSNKSLIRSFGEPQV